jgi:hypothetical protein
MHVERKNQQNSRNYVMSRDGVYHFSALNLFEQQWNFCLILLKFVGSESEYPLVSDVFCVKGC